MNKTKSYTFEQLSEAAQQRAIEKFGSKYTYPDWDDVDDLTNLLAEFVTGVLGLSETAASCRHAGYKEISISWDLDQGVGLKGNVDHARIVSRLAAKELAPDSLYGGYTGKRIIERQEALATAIEAYEELSGRPEIDWTELSLSLDTRNFSTDWEVDSNYQIAEVPNAEYIEAEIEAIKARLFEAFENYTDTCERVLHKMLKQEVDSHYSEEFIKGELISREFFFDEDGEIIDG
jgi:hypothetical protein